MFNGKELDYETGLYYYGARYYNPKVSIFLNVDPLVKEERYFDDEDLISNGGGIFNPLNYGVYSYTYNNPVMLTDPDGKCPICPWADAIVDAGFVLYDIGVLAHEKITTGKTSAENWAALGADVVSIAVPMSTGAGQAVKATMKVAKNADKANDVRKVAGITGHTKHGLHQSIGRNGGKGVDVKGKLDALKNPKKVEQQSGGRTKYVGKKVTVVINKDRKIVTNFGSSRSSSASLPQGRKTGGGKAQRRTQERTGTSYNPKMIK